MLVMLMRRGLESAAVRWVWCLLQLNTGELDEMFSRIPFLWFCEVYLKLQNLCKHEGSVVMAAERVDSAAHWHFHCGEAPESRVPALWCYSL